MGSARFRAVLTVEPLNLHDMGPQVLIRSRKPSRRPAMFLFASGLRSVDAVCAFADENPEASVFCVPQQYTSLSTRRRESSLYVSVHAHLAQRGGGYVAYESMAIEPLLLLGGRQIVWFADPAEFDPLDEESGCAACAVNVLLAEQFGLRIEYLDWSGLPLEQEFPVRLRPFCERELARWRTHRRVYTDVIAAEGLRFAPSFGEPALWSRKGGGIEVDRLDLSWSLQLRIKNFEDWLDQQPLSDADWSASDEKFYREEGAVCAQLVADELCTEIEFPYWDVDAT